MRVLVFLTLVATSYAFENVIDTLRALGNTTKLLGLLDQAGLLTTLSTGGNLDFNSGERGYVCAKLVMINTLIKTLCIV